MRLAYLAALGPIKAAQTNSIAATAVTAVVGPWASKLVALAILISIFSAANGIALTSPRVYYAMARDGLFFHRLAQVHPRFHTPAMLRVRRMSVVGSPSTRMRSARRPGAMRPRSGRLKRDAGVEVAAASASVGDKPACTSSSNSR